MKIKVITFILLLSVSFGAQAQQIHSHNDYEQNVPFWKAYAAGAASIEADVHLLNDTLFVAHDREDIQRARTLESLYLSPIRQLFVEKSMSSRYFQLLIDIKTDAYPSLQKLVELLYPLKDSLYPENPQGVKIIISGNRPRPADYNTYPDFIFFDWQSLDKPENTDKIALASLNFRNFSRWNGENPLTSKEDVEIEHVISRMKSFKKPIRFWASPDTPIAWKTLYDLGVDFIGTDKPDEAVFYFKSHLNGLRSSYSHKISAARSGEDKRCFGIPVSFDY